MPLAEMQAAGADCAPAVDLSRAVDDTTQKNGRLEVDKAEKSPSMPSLIATLLHLGFCQELISRRGRLRRPAGHAHRPGRHDEHGLAAPVDGQVVHHPADQLHLPQLAFMCFMAVAYVPAFVEDRRQFVKEDHHGMYGATEPIMPNFLVGLPYLFCSPSPSSSTTCRTL